MSNDDLFGAVETRPLETEEPMFGPIETVELFGPIRTEQPFGPVTTVELFGAPVTRLINR